MNDSWNLERASFNTHISLDFHSVFLLFVLISKFDVCFLGFLGFDGSL